MLWSLDDPREDGLLVVEYPYFERQEPQVWDERGTYVATDAEFAHNRHARRGTTGSARSSPRCSTPGWR